MRQTEKNETTIISKVCDVIVLILMLAFLCIGFCLTYNIFGITDILQGK